MSDPQKVINLHRLTSGFTEHLASRVSFYSVKHLDYEGSYTEDDHHYFFFRKNNRAWSLPLKTHRQIKKLKPEVVLTEGFVFPFQLCMLRMSLGKKCKILAQHHGERPWKGIKALLQKMTDPCIDGYLFSAIGNAQPWLEKHIISSGEKCFEVLSASTNMRQRNREECRQRTGMTGNKNFIWVGRLIDVKDPVTVLKGFCTLAHKDPRAMLHMVYQDDTLLEQVKDLIRENGLKDQVKLLGHKDHQSLEELYSSADFFIAGSHREGSGYALVEAMSCGCVPIVSHIPSFRMITAEGKRGFLCPPGDAESLGRILLQLPFNRKNSLSRMVRMHAVTKLGSAAIAQQLLAVCEKLNK
jgi:glycosyltransferase involved in cell wall biosynthesis